MWGVSKEIFNISQIMLLKDIFMFDIYFLRKLLFKLTFLIFSNYSVYLLNGKIRNENLTLH